MAIGKGESLFYITGSGEIHGVVAVSDERNGAVEIKHSGGNQQVIGPIGTLHLCRTAKGASIVAGPRLPKHRKE